MRIWEIQEYKIWKGIDRENPCWASLGFACGSWDDANDLLDYISGNKPAAILRVAPNEVPKVDAKEPGYAFERDAFASIYGK